MDDLQIDQFAPITLLTGLNGAGKTSVLEALFIHAKPLTSPLGDFDYNRGLQPRLRSTREAPWGSFFSANDREPRVRLWGRNGEQEWTVNLSMDQGSRPDVIMRPPSDVMRERISTLKISVKLSQGTKRRTLSYYSDGVIDVDSSTPDEVTPLRFIRMSTGAPVNQAALAAMYASLQESGNEEDLTKLLRHIEPRLVRLVVWTDGTDSALHADLGLARSLPLPVISDGLTRVAAVALAASVCSGGIVTIDEIENGIHVSVLGEFWRGLALIATRFKTQIIATTHSRECTQAALSAVPASDLMLQRVVRDKAGVRVQPYDAEMLQTALTAGLAFR